MLEMIEADLKLVMWMFLGTRMNDILESDVRLSKHDYGSRKGHSTENSLLEKRLMIDHVKNGRGECSHCVRSRSLLW